MMTTHIAKVVFRAPRDNHRLGQGGHTVKEEERRDCDAGGFRRLKIAPSLLYACHYIQAILFPWAEINFPLALRVPCDQPDCVLDAFAETEDLPYATQRYGLTLQVRPIRDWNRWRSHAPASLVIKQPHWSRVTKALPFQADTPAGGRFRLPPVERESIEHKCARLELTEPRAHREEP